MHLKTWEEYKAFMGGGRSVWQIQRTFRRNRLFWASQHRSHRRDLAAAAAAIDAASTARLVPANEGPPPVEGGLHHNVRLKCVPANALDWY